MQKIRESVKAQPLFTQFLQAGGGVMIGNFQVRTDLALEARESYGEDDIRIRGVKIQEEEDTENEIYTTGV